MNKWENFAIKNSEYYILTENPYPFKTKEGKYYFFESGKRFFHSSYNEIKDLLKGNERVLEIGCGVGRLLLPHSRYFKEAVGVDISPTMITKILQNAKELDIKNILTFQPHQAWDKLQYDYIYSYIVFQHIKEYSIITDYIKNISNCLYHGGVAQLQFDTRPKNILYSIRNIIPDFLLPKLQRSAIRRIRRDPKRLRELFATNNLKLIKELNPNSELHTFILEK